MWGPSDGGAGQLPWRGEGQPLLPQAAVEAVSETDAGCWPFPGEECGNWWWVDGCESGHGTHPDTYNLDAPNGGRLQINRAVWAGFFQANYGWDWASVVLDDDLNRQAAYVIWLRAGGSWSPWSCRP